MVFVYVAVVVLEECKFLQQQSDSLRRTSFFLVPAATGVKRAAESAPDVDMADASEGVQNKRVKIQQKAPTKAAVTPTAAAAEEDDEFKSPFSHERELALFAIAKILDLSPKLESPDMGKFMDKNTDIGQRPSWNLSAIVLLKDRATPGSAQAGADEAGTSSAGGTKPILPADIDKSSIAAIKIFLTDSGFETDVFEYTMRKPAPKKSDWVKLVKEKYALGSIVKEHRLAASSGENNMGATRTAAAATGRSKIPVASSNGSSSTPQAHKFQVGKPQATIAVRVRGPSHAGRSPANGQSGAEGQ
eukprot:gene5053-34844_t